MCLFLLPLWLSEPVKVRAITAIRAQPCQAVWEVAAKTKARCLQQWRWLCESPVLADGCSDHLLYGWSRKTTVDQGRIVDGNDQPSFSSSLGPAGCLDTRLEMHTSKQEQAYHSVFLGNVFQSTHQSQDSKEFCSNVNKRPNVLCGGVSWCVCLRL